VDERQIQVMRSKCGGEIEVVQIKLVVVRTVYVRERILYGIQHVQLS